MRMHESTDVEFDWFRLFLLLGCLIFYYFILSFLHFRVLFHLQLWILYFTCTLHLSDSEVKQVL